MTTIKTIELKQAPANAKYAHKRVTLDIQAGDTVKIVTVIDGKETEYPVTAAAPMRGSAKISLNE